MFHLAAYTTAIGTVVDTDIPALTDDVLATPNNHFILGQQMQMLAAMVMSGTLLRAKIASPTMRQIASPWVRPIQGSTLPGNNPNVMVLDWNPVYVPPFEEIQLQATSGTGTTERLTGLVWLSPNGPDPIPQGNIIPLRVTSTTAAVANAWSTIALTFADTVPSGIYSVLFSEMQSTNGIAHRWIFSGNPWRPGYISTAAITNRQPYAISKGQFGVMGRFRSNDTPRCQVLCNAADAAHEGYLYVQRVGNLAA